MSRSLRLAGIIAGLVLIVFGVGAALIGHAGRSEVSDTLRQEQIVGSPDMNPGDTRAALEEFLAVRLLHDRRAIEASSPSRVISASPSPTRRASGCRSSGSRAAMIEMKIRLSIPSTTSIAVSVASAAHAAGSVARASR